MMRVRINKLALAVLAVLAVCVLLVWTGRAEPDSGYAIGSVNPNTEKVTIARSTAPDAERQEAEIVARSGIVRGASPIEIRAWFADQGVDLVPFSSHQVTAFVEDAMEDLARYPKEAVTRRGDPYYQDLVTKYLLSRKCDQIEAVQNGHLVAFIVRPEARESDTQLLHRALDRFPDYFMAIHYGFGCSLVTLVSRVGTASSEAFEAKIARQIQFPSGR